MIFGLHRVHFLSSLALALGFAASLNAQIIPADRTTPWVPGVTVGARGPNFPRTHLIDVTKPPYSADKTGAADATAAIQAAINAATPNDVVFLPDGTYLIGSSLSIIKSFITLRGGTNTVLVGIGNGLTMLKVGNDRQPQAATTYNIASGSSKGSTSIFLNGQPTTFTVGDQVTVSESVAGAGTELFPVINVHQFEHAIQQQVVVTAINGNNIAISAPLMWNFSHSPVLMDCGIGSSKNVGIENLTFTDTNSVTHAIGHYSFLGLMSMCRDSWIINCSFQWANNYSLAITDSSHITVRHNSIQHALSSGSNHSGLLVGAVGESLFEDNVISDGLMPGIEFNGGFCANAVFGNLLTNNVIDIDCHNTHPMMNLWEQNDIAGSFEMDGYFGSASHQTLFRNAVRSSYLPLLFKRWTTYMNVVGNILGSPGNTYTSYASEVNNAGWMIFQFGFPNIGNNSFDGTTTPPAAWNYPGKQYSDAYGTVRPNGIFTFTNNQINTSNLIGNFSNIPAPIPGVYSLVFQDNKNTNIYYPTDGIPITAVAAGTATSLQINRSFSVSNGWTIYMSGQNPYQQLQTSNKFTHLITGNFDYFNNSIKWDTNGTQTLPASLLYTNGPPAWWGTNRWPAIGSDISPMSALIPARERLIGLPTGVGANPAAPKDLRPGG